MSCSVTRKEQYGQLWVNLDDKGIDEQKEEDGDLPGSDTPQ